MNGGGMFFQEIYPAGALVSAAPAVQATQSPVRVSASGQFAQSGSGQVSGEAPALGVLLIIGLALVLVHTVDF